MYIWIYRLVNLSCNDRTDRKVYCMRDDKWLHVGFQIPIYRSLLYLILIIGIVLLTASCSARILCDETESCFRVEVTRTTAMSI